jgi:hypothetical protein
MNEPALINLNAPTTEVPEGKVITGIAFDGREKAVEGAEPEHPWQTLGIAIGVGALIGCLLARRTRS